MSFVTDSLLLHSAHCKSMGKKHGAHAKKPCPKGCGREFAAGPMKQHLKVCGRNTPPPHQNYTLSPDEAQWPNSTVACALCPGAPLIAHPINGGMFASCAYWNDPRHRNRDAARQARNDRDVARRAAGAGGHRRPPDGSTQPDSTARSLGAGGLPPVL